MPLPMVHLHVGLKICDLMKKEATPSYMLGCISPDAIHMRKNATRDDKRRIHFVETVDVVDAVRNIKSFFRQFSSGDRTRDEFIEGFCVHLLTDLHWRISVYDNFIRNIPQDIGSEDRRTLYYRETDQVDFNLYKRPLRTHMWEMLVKAKPVDLEGILSSTEISYWRYRTLHWFDLIKEEPGIIPVFITGDTVDSFIDDVSKKIYSIMGDIRDLSK